jgi:hypothetical protein
MHFNDKFLKGAVISFSFWHYYYTNAMASQIPNGNKTWHMIWKKLNEDVKNTE